MPKPAIREGGSFRLNEGHFSDPRSTQSLSSITPRRCPFLAGCSKNRDLYVQVTVDPVSVLPDAYH